MTVPKLKKYRADIYECPKSIMKPTGELTIGDLHANVMFLIHFLTSYGVLKISEKDFLELQNLYIKKELTKADIEQFNQIIDAISIDEKPVIRLIGDEICDRGQNDYFIFKMLDKLNQSGVSIEILLSNHGIEFLNPYEKNAPLCAPNIGFNDQSLSMDNLKQLLDKGIVDKKDVDALIKRSYLPHLKLISYSLVNNHITIFSHAGIGLNVIKAVADKFSPFGVIFKDNTAEELAQTIEAINAVFANFVEKGIAHTLVEDIRNEDYNKDPVNFLIWNREYDDLNRSPKHNGYNIYYAHGHDSGEKRIPDNVFKLDNRDYKFAKNHKGYYNILENKRNHAVTLEIDGDGLQVTTLPPEKSTPDVPRQALTDKKEDKNEMVARPNISHLAEITLKSQLATLKFKAQALRKKGHTSAYNSAMSIHNEIMNAYEKLQSDDDVETFKSTSHQAIKEHRPILDKHRGWSEFLINLTLLITTLGVGLVVKGAYNLAHGKSFFFAHQTQSGKIADELDQAIDVHMTT
tara:strand:+ start:998 stop:2554 length:1557 start_codon:yes stop_codon:yes gene_type:complete